MDAIALLAFSSVFFYQLNGHVLKYLGKLKAVDPVTQVWILHIVIVVLLPWSMAKRQTLYAEMDKVKMSTTKFVFNVLVNTYLQMGINYFWLLSSQAIPVQLTSAIYQTAIGVVYVCSVLGLGEQLAFWKATGVLIAIAGVFLTSYFPPEAPHANDSTTSSVLGKEQEYQYGYGIACASTALACKVASQIFCKVQLDGVSPEFMVHYNIHMGFAHIYGFMPLMLLGDTMGAKGMSFNLDTRWPVIPAIMAAAALSSFVSYGYQTVPVVRSPLYLCRFQVLGVIFAVVFDYMFYGTMPQMLGYCGYALILISFTLVSGMVDPSKPVDKVKKVD